MVLIFFLVLFYFLYKILLKTRVCVSVKISIKSETEKAPLKNVFLIFIVLLSEEVCCLTTYLKE